MTGFDGFEMILPMFAFHYSYVVGLVISVEFSLVGQETSFLSARPVKVRRRCWQE